MNSEGYKDPTAEKAIHNAGYLPEHIWEPLKLIRRLLDIVGLELIGITVKDRKSKRKYSWGGDTVAGDDGKRKEKGIPEKVPESGKKGTGDSGRDTKTSGGQNVSERVQRWDATRQQSDRSVGLYGRD